MSFDVIVLGLGGIGSGVLHQLAARGLRVLGIEQFDVPNTHGSSHGHSRIIRQAYFEDARYVPLARRAYELWDALSLECGETRRTPLGVLNMGPPDDAEMLGVAGSVSQHGLVHERLDAEEIRARFPALRPDVSDIGIYEAHGGALPPERCVRAQVEVARRLGAEVRVHERATRVSPDRRGVEIVTDKGTYNAGHLVVCSGAWLATPDSPVRLDASLWIERQMQFWFEPKKPELFERGRLPAFVQFLRGDAFYAIPSFGAPGVKVARHHGGQRVNDPNRLERTPNADDLRVIRRFLKERLPDADGRLLEAQVCMYTNTKDNHFMVGRHPEHERVLVAGAFCGHGFKFAPVIGEGLADLVLNGRMDKAFDLFDPAR
jgi:sarcosine oxidase